MAEYKNVTVPSISCGHCSATIEREVSGLDGILSVKANHEDRSVVFEWQEPATWEQITAIMDEIGYPVSE